MYSRLRSIMALTAFVTVALSPSAHAELHGAPKNVIVFIGDGMGFNQVDASSLYEYGETGRQVYEQFPVRMGMSTYSRSGDGYAPHLAWSDFEYVRNKPTDSAAAATAMSTGVKTYNGGIGLDMEKHPLHHTLLTAKNLGKAAGVVTSVELSHATPAGFVAHNESRGNYAELAREMILDSRADVVMGAGNPLYDDNGDPAETADYKYVGGPEAWDLLTKGGTSLDGNTVEDIDGDATPDAWTLVQSKEDFEALMTGDTPKRVFGVPMVRETLQHNRDGDRKAVPPYFQPAIETVPTLETMTRAALNVLDNDPDGFFVMIEGGAIDWAGHGNNSGRLIEEMVQFNAAVAAAVEWVESHGGWDETLMIVTADHETGYLTGPGSGNTEQPDGTIKAVYNPLVNNGKGNLPGFVWNSGGHTNQLIPFYANGAGTGLLRRYADEWDPTRGYFITNTEYAQAILTLWGD